MHLLTHPLRSAFAASLVLASAFAQTPAASPAPAAAPAPSPVAVPPAPAPKVEFPTMSPASTLKQRVGLTDIEIAYSRPSMKGRAIFGSLIPYGEVWRTGANTATKITFSTAVKFGGADISAGTYELFTIPGADEWTVIIHKNMSQWGAYKYDAKNDVARVKATPVKLSAPVETFSIGLGELRDQSATLNLAWENTRVPVKLGFDLSGLVSQIEAAHKSEGKKSGGFYYNAASFFFENGLDLNRALLFADESVKLSPKAPYMMLLKARIHEKRGEKEAAITAADKAAELGVAAEGPTSGIAIQARKLAASLK